MAFCYPIGPGPIRPKWFHSADSGWLRQFPPRQAGADTQRRRPVLAILCSAFDLLLCVLCLIRGVIFGQFWLDFGSILSLGGVPGELLGALCAAPVPLDLQKCDFWLILGAPW